MCCEGVVKELGVDGQETCPIGWRRHGILLIAGTLMDIADGILDGGCFSPKSSSDVPRCQWFRSWELARRIAATLAPPGELPLGTSFPRPVTLGFKLVGVS